MQLTQVLILPVILFSQSLARVNKVSKHCHFFMMKKFGIKILNCQKVLRVKFILQNFLYSSIISVRTVRQHETFINFIKLLTQSFLFHEQDEP